ncbi:M28 family metallopeptidase [Gymnodinialimonas hymeniacidonis]|uniref:M28 family metallopeptidase n=1 Tax=Gymnodinialimonas hymeniacidonis TaxID=3126508 RepID=UPI0034C6AE94
MMDRRMVLAGAAALAARPGWAQGDPIAALVDQVSQEVLVNTVYGLTSFPTRFTDHPQFPVVEEWVHDVMALQGDVTRFGFQMPSGKTRHNFILGDASDTRGVILIGAHYDSASEDSMNNAPGANDNATGMAAMLEAYRILSGAGLNKSVVAMAFAGEEQGFYGSAAIAEFARAEGWPIEMMINLDMLGWRPPNPAMPMIVEYDMGNAVAGNDAASASFGQMMAEVAADYTTLNTSHTDIWASDYMPFEATGFPAMGLYDGGVDDPRYGTSRDIPDVLDFGRLQQATRMVIAGVARYCGLSEPI